MMIETDRLYLMPLTAHQLKLWIEDISALEKELGVSYLAEPMQGVFLDIDSIASQHILERCGFKKYKQCETFCDRIKIKK